MFKLVIQDDEGKTTVVPLIRDEITIGRKEGNTIRLTERNVSRRHARILRNNGEVSIEDLGSYNGIRVNNARIAERVALRVSDQVQIGDYKLYLKAEGVEQVDDARTMPIERVDAAAGAPTDVIPAIAAAAPTAPVAVQSIPTPAPGQLPPKAPNVAVADTDPQGRPVASPAQVAALTQQPGYGRLVVLSSNFAGKEFELSRPQMIVGRTDENDLVVNHRSISRNHAKIVREPDTGRYTISDLQSSNGVRVNGQDYGKVELRRGDVIDLGHVRLRFVEPGEDFVFSRDAVITDVPEAGGKKGVFIFIGLAVLVLAVTVVFLMKGGGEDTPKGGSGTGGDVANPTADARDKVTVNDPPIVDAVEVEPPAIDAQAVNPTNSEEKELVVECKKAIENRKWASDLSQCAEKLAAIKSPLAQEYSDIAGREANNEKSLRDLEKAAQERELDTARELAKKIGDQSVYSKAAKSTLEKAENALTNALTADLRRAIKDCDRYNARARDYDKYGGNIVARAKANAGKCQVVVVEQPKTCPGDFQCTGETECKNGKCVKQVTVAPACNFDNLKSQGEAASSAGNDAEALKFWDQAMKCKPDYGVLRRAFLAACKSRNVPRATTLYLGLGKSDQGLVKRCLDNGFDPRPPGQQSSPP